MTGLTVHAKCGRTWQQHGNRTGHCARCHLTFEGVSLFDAHQRIQADGSVVCLDPHVMKVGGLPLIFDGSKGDGSWRADSSRLRAHHSGGRVNVPGVAVARADAGITRRSGHVLAVAS